MGKQGGSYARRKGHDFERYVARRLREVYGEGEVRRGEQAHGAKSPDVGTPWDWIECKKGCRVNLGAAFRQAQAEQLAAGDGVRTPVAVCMEDRGEAIVVMRLEDFLFMRREQWSHRQRIMKALDDLEVAIQRA